MNLLKLKLTSAYDVFLTDMNFHVTYKTPLMGVFVISSPLDQFQIYPVLGSTITNFLVSGLLSLILIILIILIILLCLINKTPTTPTTPTTPEELSFKNKPIQGGFGFDSIWLLLLAYITKSPEYGQNLLPFDLIILTKADPFFFNMCLLYLNVCEFCILLTVFFLFTSLFAICVYIYNKLPNLKSYFSKKENALWAALWLNVIPVIIVSKFIFNPYGSRFYNLINSFIVFINSGSFTYLYYNPPGLAMGSSRVLHPADYTPIATYFNLQYINPDYILHVVTFIKYIAIFVIAYIVYFIIATVTTGIYNTDKTALSLPGGPASLNLFTKCFYFKSQQARINSLLKFFAIVLILMTLASIVLYHYIYLYKIG